MLQFRSIRVVLALALLLNTAPAATVGQQLPLPPLDTGRFDENSVALSSSRSATVVSGHIDSALAGSVPVDNLTLEDSRVTTATQGSATTSRVSVASNGAQGDGASARPAISPDGRYVVFSSQSGNLVTGDTNNADDIFVHDRQMRETSRVSVTSSGGQGDGPSIGSSISADGRYVAFRSMAGNLVNGDTNNQDDVFLHDRQTGQTIRISVHSSGAQGDGPSIKPIISADGYYVAFESWATNLVNGDNNGQEDVFLYDRQTRQIARVSVAPGGAEANDQSDLPAMSADGRYVAFASEASNLVVGDNNTVCDTDSDGVYTDNCPDVFVYDRDADEDGILDEPGQVNTTRVSVGSGGTQARGWSAASSLSADGRYVAFESQADNLVIGDTNGVYDIFVHDRQTSQTWRVSVDSNGRQGNGESRSPSTSADGRYVAFVSRADSLAAGDTNGTYDVFVRDRETRRTIRVSVATDGRQGLDSSGGPSLSADGRYVAFSSLASNLVNGDTNGQDDVFVRDRGDGLGNTMTIPLVSGSDDASVDSSCIYRPDRNAIYLGRCTDGSSITSGFRFRNIQIAPGTVISEAHLEFTVDGPFSNDIALQIFGQASANSAPFSDTDRPSDRPLTTSSANWNIPASDVWSVEQSRRSPDLASVVQEIVNLSGWTSGNSLTVILRANPAVAGTTHRRVFAWEREENGDRTARLVVTFRGEGTIPPPTSTFIDVPIDYWAHDAIETLHQAGVTAACSRDPLMYCPDSSMNRAETAMFVGHGMHGIGFIPTQPITQVFADVPLNSWAAKWATAVWAKGYNVGCATNPLRYCPWQTHTRAEGSVLYLRVLNGTNYAPPAPAGIFVDVPLDQWYARWAEAAYNAGLIPACQTSPQLRFCPNDPMTRAMSAYAMTVAKRLHDTTPPDGRITFPTNGSTIGPDTTSVFIKADAWDNPGGSGVAKVRFFVEYDGVRNHVCTDQDANPSCPWSIPAGLTSQQLVFTINVVDRAGNIKENAGEPVYVNYQADGDGDGGGRDTTPPDGRITSPPDGYRIPPGTGSVLIRAEASDNQGGSGVASVVFYVEYDGVRHRVCTKSDSNPSCTWSIPAGLAAQTVIFTINIVDRAGNIQENAGGPVYVTFGEVPPSLRPRLTASPASVPADGTSRSTITLSNAPVGHQVRLISNRGNADIFENATGTVNSSGQFVTTIRSSTRGTAIITTKDLTTGQTFAASTQVSFSMVPPPESVAPIITDVRPQYPLDARYLKGISVLNRVDVTVDWKGTTPGRVDFILNGVTYSKVANSSGASHTFDMGRGLRPGRNSLRIVAYNAAGQSSQALDFSPYLLEKPAWMVALQAIGALAEFVLAGPVSVGREYKATFKFPSKPISLGAPKFGPPGSTADLQFFIGGSARLGLECDKPLILTGEAGVKPKLDLMGLEFGGELKGSGKITAGVVQCRIPAAEGTLRVDITVYGQKNWPVLTFIIDFIAPGAGVALEQTLRQIGLYKLLTLLGELYLKGSLGSFFESGVLLQASDPFLIWKGVRFGGGPGIETGYQLKQLGAEFRVFLGAKGELAFENINPLVDLTNIQFDKATITGEGGWELKPPLLTCKYGRTYRVKWIFPPSRFEATLVSEKACSLFGGGYRGAYAVFRSTPDTRHAYSAMAVGLQPTDIAVQTTFTSVLVSNVYTYTEPSLAVNTGNNNALLLWVHDDIAKPVGQSHEIYFSRWNGSSWSVPAGVTNDGVLDGAPQVAWTNDGRAVAIWQRLNDTLPITATWDVTTANKIEIATATYNPANGTWSPVALLASNDALDLTPRLARNEAGRLLAVWRQNSSGFLSGDDANPDRIMTAFYDSGWSAPSVAVPNVPGLVDLAAGYGDGTALIAFTQYITPTGYPTPTLQLFTTAWSGGTWSTPLQRTDDAVGHRNPQVVYNAANQPLVVWLAGDELRLRNLATGDIVDLVLLAEIGNIDEFRVVQDATGNIAALFTAQISQRDLYVAFYDQVHNLWGNPARLTNDRASEAYPAPALDSTGRLLMGYSATAITSVTRTVTISETGEVITFTVPSEGQTDLLTLSHVFARNLTLNNTGLTVSDFHPAPGNNTVVLSAAVHNSGDLALDGVAVSFYDGNPSSGGTLIGTAALTEPLAAGFTATLTRTYNVPVTGGVRTIYAVADPANVIAEVNETDNIASLAAFGPDLEIVNASVDYWGGSQVGLQTVIHNIGPSAAPATALAFYRTALTGTLAVTDTVPALAPDETIAINTPWNFGAPPAGSYPLVAAVNAANFTEVFTANNIYTFALDVRPDLMVSPYYLRTTSPTATTVLVTTTVFNVGAITATDVVVGFYGNDRLNDDSPLFTRTIPLLGPAESTTLNGQVAGPLACTLYVYVDPAGVIAETTRANNLAGIDYRGLCQRIYLPLILRNR